MSAEERFDRQVEECLKVVTPDSKQGISGKDLKNRASRLNNIILNKISALFSFNKEKWEYYVEFCRRHGYDAKPFRSASEMLELENSVTASLETLPKVAVDRLDLNLEYNHELVRRLTRIKALYLARKIHYDSKPELKKTDEFGLYKEIYGLLADVRNAFIGLGDMIHMFYVFKNFTLFFTELPYNRAEIDRFLEQLAEVLVPIFDVDIEKITPEKCAIVSQINNRLVMRLSYYYGSLLFKSYRELIDTLETRSSVIFYRKVITKYPGQTLKQIYGNPAITALKKDFIKRKLEFFYHHLEVIVGKIASINTMDKAFHDLQTEFSQKSNAFMTDEEQQKQLRQLLQKQMTVYNSFHREYNKTTDSKIVPERSLQELFDDLLKAYAMLMMKDVKPSSKVDLIKGYLKSIRQTVPKYEQVNNHDLAVIKNVMNERNIPLLKIYYLALIKLVGGNGAEELIVEPIIDQIRQKKPDIEVKSPAGIAYLQLSKAITPEDIVNVLQVLRYLPKDRARFDTPLGSFFITLANLYYQNLKKEIDYPTDIRPVGNKEKYIAALIDQKLIKLYFAAMNQMDGDRKLLDLFKDETEAEKKFLERIEQDVAIKVSYRIESLIAFWERETYKAVRLFLTASAEQKQYAIKLRFQELKRTQVEQMIEHFTDNHLRIVDRHIDFLNSLYNRVFRNGIYPSFKEELLLLHIAYEKLYTLKEKQREKYIPLLDRIEQFKYDIREETENLA